MPAGSQGKLLLPLAANGCDVLTRPRDGGVLRFDLRLWLPEILVRIESIEVGAVALLSFPSHVLPVGFGV
jgi:hypothetical protein